jgi:CRISPR-associated protein Cas2
MTTLYCITYDIASPRRLARLHRRLKRSAMAVQYSVFFGELSEAGLRELKASIEAIIDPRKDDVRIYALSRTLWTRTMGRPLLPEGIGFTGLPLVFQCARQQQSQLPGERLNMDPAPRKNDPSGTRRAPLTLKQQKEARRIQAIVQTGDRRGLQLL